MGLCWCKESFWARKKTRKIRKRLFWRILINLSVINVLILFYVNPLRAQSCGKYVKQIEINKCYKNMYKKADSTLNDLYEEIISKIDSSESKRLRKVERVWIRYRDQHCEAISKPSKGGSIKPLIKFACLERLTENRIESLKAGYQREP